MSATCSNARLVLEQILRYEDIHLDPHYKKIKELERNIREASRKRQSDSGLPPNKRHKSKGHSRESSTSAECSRRPQNALPSRAVNALATPTPSESDSAAATLISMSNGPQIPSPFRFSPPIPTHNMLFETAGSRQDLTILNVDVATEESNEEDGEEDDTAVDERTVLDQDEEDDERDVFSVALDTDKLWRSFTRALAKQQNLSCAAKRGISKDTELPRRQPSRTLDNSAWMQFPADIAPQKL